MEQGEYHAMHRFEDTYWWYQGVRELTATAMWQYASQAVDLKILDAGCGTGGQLAHFKNREPSVEAMGMDVSGAAVRLAALRKLDGLLQGSVMQLPFQDHSLDVITCIDVLYIREVDDTVALEEFRRVLRPGGIVVMNLPALELLRGRHDRAVHTRHRYTRGEVKDLLNGAGFQIVELSYWNMFLFPMVLAKRTLDRVFRAKSPPASDMSALPTVLNRVLISLLRLENKLLFATGLPIGSSIFAVARRTS